MKKGKKILGAGIKNELWCYLFLLPWLLGTIFFFIKPFFQAFYYAFNEVTFEQNAIVYEFVGLEHFRHAFQEDPVFVRYIVSSITGLLSNTVLIIFFSIFIAMTLNAKFRGRTVIRAIFFLPVIVANGVVIQLINSDSLAQMLMSGGSMMFEATTIKAVLLEAGFAEKLIDMFLNIINSIFSLSWKSGIQILLYLAGLQSVPRQLYEAARVEEATAWEQFWKITVPMLMPITLLNIIFTITEQFTDYQNPTMSLVLGYSRELKMGYSSALALMYFIVVLVIVGITYGLIKRKTFYIND